MKTWDKDTDPNLIKRSSAALVDSVAQSIPGLSIAWSLGKALYGNALVLRQQRAMEFVENIQANPDLFTEKLLETVTFQDAFIVALEDYIKLRSVLKRGISKAIFNGSARCEDLESFELGRLNSTLRSISPNALAFMSFVTTKIEPIRQQRIKRDVEAYDIDNSPVSEEAIRESVSRQQILSYAYKDWMQGREKYKTVMVPSKMNPEHPNITGSGAVCVVSDESLTKHNEALNELSTLGIIDRRQYSETTMTYDSTPTWIDRWYYSEYGNQFVRYVKEAGQGERFN